MTDIRAFAGFAPTHCTVCGSKWEAGCKAPCINAPQVTTPSTQGEADHPQAAIAKSGMNP